ncbi:hypothetical protein OE88DRAFT_1017206 [Heliocybe sulcata]|uniref:RlpA-like protein double-psi beta-barrel domain-containing protein n=1 Tax=Heliocybe sulcata TaxID=5364 RepID=A0A5C3NNL5_9AGAM|nr:hypothetical protein OE88DRAFT_1017206 [Heliocybe sulcata]
MRRCIALSSIFALSLSFFGLASADSSHAQLNRRHHVARNDLASRETHQLGKRFDNARFTYFQDGLGACGQYNGPNDFIVAVNIPQYDGGSHCFETITITANGKTTQATVADECEGCPYGALDFSEGLFKFFASEDQGTIYGSWEFGSGAKPSTSTPPPPPSTTSTWSSTSTWSPPPTTSSKKPKTTSSTSTTSSTPTSTSSSTSSTPTPSSSSSSAAPSTTSSAADTLPTASESNPDNLEQFNMALVNLAGLVMAAATATS